MVVVEEEQEKGVEEEEEEGGLWQEVEVFGRSTHRRGRRAEAFGVD